MSVLGNTNVMGELCVNGKRVPSFYMSTGNPVGGTHGDVWLKYSPTASYEILNAEEVTLMLQEHKTVSMNQDMVLLENDLRLMDIEDALAAISGVSVIPLMTVGAMEKGSSFDLLMRMIKDSNYSSKESMEATIQKYRDRNRITEQEHIDLVYELYPDRVPVILPSE